MWMRFWKYLNFSKAENDNKNVNYILGFMRAFFSIDHLGDCWCRPERFRYGREKSVLVAHRFNPLCGIYSLFSFWVQKGKETKYWLTLKLVFYIHGSKDGSHRLVVRTPASHAGNAGSNPAGITTSIHKGLRQNVNPFFVASIFHFLFCISNLKLINKIFTVNFTNRLRETEILL